jgi:hypothetical protein
LAAPETEDELGKWVFDAPADEITNDTGQAVGLSKAAFITTILDDNDLSGAFDRSAFRAIFNIIRAITAPAMPAPIAGN